MLLKNLLLAIPFLIAIPSSYATMCDDENNYRTSLTSHECATMAAGAAVATGSGIYSAKKYSHAKIFEKKNTESVYKSSIRPEIMDPHRARNYVRVIQDGDKVSFTYELSEVENRQFHIELMETRAAEARSSASYHRLQSFTAKKTVWSGTGKNRTSRRVADHYARAQHALTAIAKDAEAIEYDRKALDARSGGKVPMYSHDKVITDDAGTKNLSQDFIDERARHESKIKTITRLPLAKFTMLKSIINKGRAGLAGVAIGGIFLVEEMISGKAAEELENRDSSFEIDLSDF